MKERQLPSNYRVSIKALIRNAEGKLLMLKEGSEAWGIPGGGLDHGESIEQGLRREIREELKSEVAKMAPLPILAAPYYYEPINRWRLWLLYEVELAGEPQRGENVSAIGWFGPDKLPTLELDKTEIEAVWDVFKLIETT